MHLIKLLYIFLFCYFYQTINIAFVCDDKYAYLLSAALISIKNSSTPADKCNIYILHPNLSQSAQHNLKTIENKNFKINFIKLQLDSLTKYGNKSYPAIVFAKAMIPGLFAHLKKILILDVDIIVRHSLHDLWETDIEQCLAAVIQSQYLHGSKCKKYTKSHLIKNNQQFNSGVMLINIPRYLEQKMTKAFFEEANRIRHIGDESIFVNIFNNNVKFLDLKWNVCPISFKHAYPYFSTFTMYSEKIFNNAIQDPYIVHFADKSYAFPEHKFHKLFLSFLSQNLFPNEYNALNTKTTEYYFIQNTSIKTYFLKKMKILYKKIRANLRIYFET